MPFAKRAVVTIARRDPGAIDVSGTVDVDAAPFGTDSLLFHAGWRPREIVRDAAVPRLAHGRHRGRGHLVGTLLNVENPPDAAWWGEGDEKIYVDGETFPSLFGTGTEDYFGYAWSTPERFEHAYHAQTRAAGGGFGGLFSMNRFHVLDPIPFARSLRFDLEIWHWQDTSIAVDAPSTGTRARAAGDDLPRLFVDGIGRAARRQVGADADAGQRRAPRRPARGAPMRSPNSAHPSASEVTGVSCAMIPPTAART